MLQSIKTNKTIIKCKSNHTQVFPTKIIKETSLIKQLSHQTNTSNGPQQLSDVQKLGKYLKLTNFLENLLRPKM